MFHLSYTTTLKLTFKKAKVLNPSNLSNSSLFQKITNILYVSERFENLHEEHSV